MITIDQLLESADLDFEPRWIAKDDSGLVCAYTEKPLCGSSSWYCGGRYKHIGYLKLYEFDGKDWTECIYEVPRKTTGKLKHIERIDDSFVDKINTIIDAVNELKGANQ